MTQEIDLSKLPPAEPYDKARDEAQRARLMKVWETPTGWRRISAVNNSSVGKWYLLTSFAFFTFAGFLALLIRAQLAVPNNDLLSQSLYNQLFTLHGTAMMFLFAVPIFEAVAILILPAILGARDLPFPRLSAFGYWCFLIGGVFVCGSVFFGVAPQGGWFMYTPLSSNTDYSGLGADIWLLGLSFIEVSSIAAAVELIVGVLKSRPPGMRLNLIPLYCWYVLVVAGMILFAFPPLIAGDLLLEMERAFDWAFFDPDRGGDPLLWQHLFWIFGHPEVYIVFLPSIALIATILPTFAGRPMLGHSWIVLSAVGVAFLSFGLWVHHMFTTGLPEISLSFFSAASEAVALPTGIQIFCFIATMLVSKVRRSVPMLFAGGALAIFVFGGLTGVMVALVPFDWQAHDTHFVVAHLHYTLIGGMLFPLFAGVHYWYPFVTQKKMSDRLGRWSFWLMFGGFNLAFLPMHWTGVMGMPRRVWTYDVTDGWAVLNMVSTVGAFVFAAGFVVLAVNVLWPRGKAPLVERNLWNAGTMEWGAEVPDKPWGVRSIPYIHTRYPLWEQKGLLDEIDRGEWFLPDAKEGKRELIITDILDARPLYVQRVGGPSYLTLGAAGCLGAVFILATFHLWALTLIFGAGFVGFTLWWLWTGTSQIPEVPEKAAGRGLVLPTYAQGNNSPGWWAVFITMTGDMTAFMGLVFSYFFYWTALPDFLPSAVNLPGFGWLLVGLALLLAGWGTALLARTRLAGGSTGQAMGLLVAGVPLGALGLGAWGWAAWSAGLDPTETSFDATVWILILWIGVHLLLDAVMRLYVAARIWCGHCTPRYHADSANLTLFTHFVALTAVVIFALLALFPMLMGVA
ncbi:MULTISPECIES: cbb3-type cytochrome c oxidase subunit I [unclassified Salipiger]|uniref:cbb3-type cytochrome c oxidase subunit I n=1 Tax=unclassified Salipiger TaxID=2640570 RepID=UPI0013B9B995|nr:MULTISPECIES: cbb3-type cytochrome c oxidase subunit I [unclassified Salipiger]NDV52552.1 cytochrome ubiquinol oxidase subunit I [Salipiger sp. PrR003]NDW32721.1 cytochrome ubiquinol oxidase subunit I [Salipiger sp. PrR007]